jgi:hypothetical protein
VDDIFLIYDSTRISTDSILKYIDTIHSWMHAISPQSWQAHLRTEPWGAPPFASTRHQPLPPPLLTLPVIYQLSHSAHSSCPNSARMQPTQQGMYFSLLTTSHNSHNLYSDLSRPT